MSKLRSLIARRLPFRSQGYWENRYQRGGNSGAGSYGRLAKYKADFINRLAEDEGIKHALEFGSGDGHQCSLFEFEKYQGVDVSHEAVRRCKEKFYGVREWDFFHADDPEVKNVSAPLVLSLDVIYHLIEDKIFELYMKRLFASSARLVLIYSSDKNEESIAKHVRHRKYTDWVERNVTAFKLEQEWPHPFPMADDSDPNETSFAHFTLFRRCS